MPLPIDLTFRDMTSTPALQDAVARWVERLEHLEPQITHVGVVIERPHQRQRQGQIFHVRLEIQIPGTTIVVGRDPARDDSHEDVYVALADAFRAAKRQLQDAMQIRRGEIKAHA